jgi:capsular polysaccharide biosynthesis protein
MVTICNWWYHLDNSLIIGELFLFYKVRTPVFVRNISGKYAQVFFGLHLNNHYFMFSAQIPSHCNSYKYIRPQKRKALQSLYDKYADVSGQISCRQFSNVRLSPLGQIEDIDSILTDSRMIIDDLDLVARIDDSVDVEDCTIIYGGYMHYHWGHFLINTLSRLWPIVADSELQYSKIVFFSADGESHPIKDNLLQVFRILGIADKVEVRTSPSAFSKVIVPDLSFSIEHCYSREFAAIFQRISTLATPHAESKYTKIFLTRSSLTRAKSREINIGMLDTFMEDNGFKVIAPEKYTIEELIGILSRATEIATISGTTAHNLLFANPNAKVTIFERHTLDNNIQPAINLSVGYKTTYVDASVSPMIINQGGGPFLYYATPQLSEYASNRQYSMPHNEMSKAKLIRRYMHSYYRLYGYSLNFEMWQISEMPAFAEAYQYALEQFRPWLMGQRPISIYDWFRPRTVAKYIKHMILRYR